MGGDKRMQDSKTHLLWMIESHGGIKFENGFVWVGNTACGTVRDWDKIIAAIAEVEKVPVPAPMRREKRLS